MAERDDALGPFIVWQDSGVEGWGPTSYDTIKEALLAPKYASRWVLTKTVDFEVVEAMADLPLPAAPAFEPNWLSPWARGSGQFLTPIHTATVFNAGEPA